MTHGKSKGQLQTRIVELTCLNQACGLPVTAAFKHGGNRYCLCDDCRQWSVYNAPTVTDAMERIYSKRYGSDEPQSTVTELPEEAE